MSRKKRILQTLEAAGDAVEDFFAVKPKAPRRQQASPSQNPLAVELAKAAATRAPRRRQEPIENIIAYPEFAPEGAPLNMLYGRPMRSAEEATYASRNMSLAEIEDALASGVFRLPPSGETKHGAGKKWWSPADEEGVFGRTWVKGSDTVRVPMSAFTPNKPLSVKAAQRWDREAGAWVPMVPGATRKARGGLAVKRKKK